MTRKWLLSYLLVGCLLTGCRSGWQQGSLLSPLGGTRVPPPGAPGFQADNSYYERNPSAKRVPDSGWRSSSTSSGGSGRLGGSGSSFGSPFDARTGAGAGSPDELVPVNGGREVAPAGYEQDLRDTGFSRTAGAPRREASRGPARIPSQGVPLDNGRIRELSELPPPTVDWKSR